MAKRDTKRNVALVSSHSDNERDNGPLSGLYPGRQCGIPTIRKGKG